MNTVTCPECHGLGATIWIPDSSPVGGYWQNCLRCGGLGVLPDYRPEAALPAALTDESEEEPG